jgi:hypothetical protein
LGGSLDDTGIVVLVFAVGRAVGIEAVMAQVDAEEMPGGGFEAAACF